MKIGVKDLLPNPFRNRDYPINEEKLEDLIESIRDTTFWNNIIGRKNKDGKYEIVYGHHRLAALKKAGIREIDLIVQELSDGDMVERMANENLPGWSTDMNAVREIVRMARNILFNEFKDKNSSFWKFKNSKRQDGGKRGLITVVDIQWRLKGAWKLKRYAGLINQALKDLEITEKGIIEEEEMKKITIPSHARAISKAAEQYFPEPPKNEKERTERKKIVKTVTKQLETGQITAKGVDQAIRIERGELKDKERRGNAPPKSRTELAGEEFTYQQKLLEILMVLPSEPPKELTEHGYKILSALAKTIIKRLRRFEDGTT